MKIKLVFLLGAVIFFTSACEKTDVKISKKDLLTAGAWIVEKAEEKEGSDPWEDVFPLWAACYKDNIWLFKTNMTVEYNESLQACSPNTPNQVLDVETWAFSDNETKIVAGGVTYLIEVLDERTLKVFDQETINGITTSSRVTFRH